MKTLVIGSGGREHAIVWKLAQSPTVSELFCAPGNPGIAAHATNVDLATDDVEGLTELAGSKGIDLTVVGPEVPLAAGIVDRFRDRGLRIYGPSQYAAQLESSKVFSKEFMLAKGIPTAQAEVATTSDEARAAAAKIGTPHVLKADGLAAGKGVLIVESAADLEDAIRQLFVERRFGSASDRVLVEPFLEGEEVSLMGLSDGRRILPFVTSKDYKRIGDDDTGPNTGGMGTHSPSGVLSEEMAAEINDTVLQPAVDGMAADGHPLVGIVYAGLMLTAEGPRTLEYNIRLGDPEAQVLLMRLEDDLGQVLRRGADGDFGIDALSFTDRAAVCLVLASRGYPDSPAKGDVITGLDEADALDDVVVFHAGTAAEGDEVIATGGRVVNVCAFGDDLEAALDRAYEAAELVRWDNRVLRRDIGRRVVSSCLSPRVSDRTGRA